MRVVSAPGALRSMPYAPEVTPRRATTSWLRVP